VTVLPVTLFVTPPGAGAELVRLGRPDFYSIEARWGADLYSDRLGPAVRAASGHVEHQVQSLVPTSATPLLRKPLPAELALDGSVRWKGTATYAGRRDVDGAVVIRHELRSADAQRLEAQDIEITMESGTVADLAGLFTAAVGVTLSVGAAGAITVGAVAFSGTALQFLEELGRFTGSIVAQHGNGAWLLVRLADPPSADVGTLPLSLGAAAGWVETELLSWQRNAVTAVGRTLDSDDNPVPAATRELTSEADLEEAHRIRLRVAPWFRANLAGAVSNIVPTLRVRDLPPTALSIAYPLDQDAAGAAALKAVDPGERWRIVAGAEATSAVVAQMELRIGPEDELGALALDAWQVDEVEPAMDSPLATIQSIAVEVTAATIDIAIANPPAASFRVWRRYKRTSATAWTGVTAQTFAAGTETGQLRIAGISPGTYDVQALYGGSTAPTDWSEASSAQFTTAADLRLRTVAVNGTDVLGSNLLPDRLAATVTVTRGGSVRVTATAVATAAEVSVVTPASATNITTARAVTFSVTVTNGGRTHTVIVTVQVDVRAPAPTIDTSLSRVTVGGRAATGLPGGALSVSVSFSTSAGGTVAVHATPSDPSASVRLSRSSLTFARNTSTASITRTASVSIIVSLSGQQTAYSLRVTATIPGRPPTPITLNLAPSGEVDLRGPRADQDEAYSLTGGQDTTVAHRQWNYHANIDRGTWRDVVAEVTLSPDLAASSAGATMTWYNSTWSDSGDEYQTQTVALPHFNTGSERAQLWYRVELSQPGQTTRRYLIRLRLFRASA